MRSGNTHVENREWAFETLDTLQFYLDDEDFHGDIGDERTAIERKRKELRDGKYRVVFLGAFNVGKSTLINALLGDEYLPTVLEECTAKVTHVTKADEMKTCINLTSPASESELAALEEFLSSYNIETQVSQTSERCELVVLYNNRSARELRTSLNALITMGAEEDYPQLRTLRTKFEEIFVNVPGTLIEDDIALIDSPGVRSISESNTKLTHDIIPHSHLVICLIDSQSAGSEQDREFIEMIVKHRHRKVMFVINKADQLNEEEIDPLGHRGPAKDLFRSLQGVVEGPELFFISSLYALVSVQLSETRIKLEALDANNKIKIPFTVQRELIQREEPEQAVAAHLLEQSRLRTFKQRLLDYLYTENREGTILESVCRFLSEKAWKFARPLEIQLETARDNPRLDELKKVHEKLVASLGEKRRQTEQAVSAFNAMCAGEAYEGAMYTGYGALVEDRFSKFAIDKEVVEPLRQWIQKDENLKRARRAGYKPLREEMGDAMRQFVERVQAKINQEIEKTERPARERLGKLLGDAGRIEAGILSSSPADPEAIRAGMAASCAGFFVGGAVLCSTIGYGVATWTAARVYIETALLKVPQVETFLADKIPAGIDLVTCTGTLAGAILGAAAGLAAHFITLQGARRKKVQAAMTEQVNRILIGEMGQDDRASVKTQLHARIETRRADLEGAVNRAFDTASAKINAEIEEKRVEGETLRRKQEETIARLEPKFEKLSAISEGARGIAEANASHSPAPSHRPDQS